MRGIVVGGRAAWQKRMESALSIIPPFVGGLAALSLVARHGVTRLQLITFLVSYVLTGVGAGIGLHRHFSHRSFQTGPALRFLLGALATMALQGRICEWVANHRRHHAHTDRAGDPYSPWVDGYGRELRGFWGFWHAHVGWLFDATTSDMSVFGAGLDEDRLVMFFSRTWWLWSALSIALPYGIGYLAGGPDVAWGVMLVGGCLRATVLHNVIWSINSFGHSCGAIGFEQKNASRNNLLLTLLAFGDGLHNNHHRFPRSAFQGLRPGELDLGGRLIATLERLGLVWGVVRIGSLHTKTTHSVPIKVRRRPGDSEAVPCAQGRRSKS